MSVNHDLVVIHVGKKHNQSNNFYVYLILGIPSPDKNRLLLESILKMSAPGLGIGYGAHVALLLQL